MDIKLKNKYYINFILVLLCMILFGLSFMCGVDVIINSKYISKNAYFQSNTFTNEISNFYNNVESYYITYKNYDKKTTEEKLSQVQEEINYINENYGIELKEKEQEIKIKYDDTKDRTIRLEEVKKEYDGKVNKAIEEVIKNREKDYKNIKSSLEERKDIKYYIKNLSNGEIYTNIAEFTDMEEYIKSNSIYTLRFNDTETHQKRLNYINTNFRNNNWTGYFIIPNHLEGYSQIHLDYKYYNSLRNRILKEIAILLVTLSAGIGLFLYLKKNDGIDFDNIKKFSDKLRKIPLDIRIILFFLVLLWTVRYSKEVSFFYKPLDFSHFTKLIFPILSMLYIILNAEEITKLIGSKEERKAQWNESLTMKFAKAVKESFLIKSIMFKVTLMVMLTIFLGVFLILGIIGIDRHMGFLVMISLGYVGAYILIIPYYILKKISYLNKVIKGADQIVSGDLNYAIEENNKGNLGRLAHNINNMKMGFKNSLESQVKSERLKSELITNVSHDLKTPLTSIMNYVDLLKKENLSKEEVEGYVGVLDRKTQRLKTLIEDLFEAAKMASGSVELNLERVDVVSLLNQALGEFDEKIKASSLTFKVKLGNEKIYANLDGKKTWRVFENLISNALKYSQKDTRVYITLEENENHIIFAIKNISAYEMDFEVDEIFDRFKRGDQSRNTEGSGLGLAIAKSIVDMQGGSLQIQKDGDLFKAIVRFNK
ncbi:sensor histidine kinase [Clostridium malenominatum]|uniref:histidine kinase n=1 Tax=Clostridium malenominatum TaxID=1539 RepID=A0ABN1J1W2_9CLOT